MKYRHKPTVVTAIQLKGPTQVDRPDGGMHVGKSGDWLVEGLDGDTFIVSGGLFERLYTPVPSRAKS